MSGAFALALALALLPAVAGAATFTAVAGEGDGLAAPPLVDIRNGGVDLRHGTVVLSFIYTRCADARMCPAVTARFARMRTLLAGTNVRLLEVTLDPGYDSPAVLRRYARAVGADGERWTFATGEPRALAAFAERAGLTVDRPRPGLIAHTDAVLVARDGIVARSIPGVAWTADEVAAEARAVAELPNDPLQRLALRALGGLTAVCGRAGIGGITPLAAAALFAGLLAAAGFAAWRLVRSVLTPR